MRAHPRLMKDSFAAIKCSLRSGFEMGSELQGSKLQGCVSVEGSPLNLGKTGFFLSISFLFQSS